MPDLYAVCVSLNCTDTADLDPVARRATPRDTEMAALLRARLSNLHVPTDTLYADVQHAKSDTASLSTVDLLRRDETVRHARGAF